MSQNKPKKYQSKRKKRNTVQTPVLLALGGVLLIVLSTFALRGNTSPGDSPPKVPIEVSDAPSLKVDQEVIDLGDAKLDQAVQASFQLANVGDETLRFSKQPYIEVVEGC